MRVVHAPVDPRGPRLPKGAPSQYGAMLERQMSLEAAREFLENCMYQAIVAVAIRDGRGAFAWHPGVHDGGTGPRPTWPRPYWYFEYLPESVLMSMVEATDG